MRGDRPSKRPARLRKREASPHARGSTQCWWIDTELDPGECSQFPESLEWDLLRKAPEKPHEPKLVCKAQAVVVAAAAADLGHVGIAQRSLLCEL